ITYKLGIPGEHHVMNSLSILAAVHALGADLALAAMTLATLNAPTGRGERHIVHDGDRHFVVVDESYNANPASMRAAIATLGAAEVKGSGRRIAVLGDMLELGEDEASMHRGLSGPLADAGIDQVFACGPLMKNLYEDLPAACKAGYAERSEALLEQLASQLGDGDVVMIKGSLGSRMGLIVDGLLALHSDEDVQSGAGE
ncbi:MAG TPA: UDP-N-acetylmuramoylalanyl-D-glutamyl-2, 6-diaminopimelate--D-alanyl-D-alanine ligase, partial [Rhodobiaceae bacterium]|nr:UDP-N-acetylmuramoylalanyl-D-glutamyl-2, 6-diaminopimelate--D-alanyl-D-alanine ligase [Rhodobiaceae bacterium]